MIFTNKDLKKLIVPLIMEQALAITVGMADTMMISSVGEAAVSGVSLVDMFNNLVIAVLAALATPASSWGRTNRRRPAGRRSSSSGSTL